VSAAREAARAVTAAGAAAARAPATPTRAEAPALARRLAARLGAWVPRVAWTIGRTGRPGLVGIALLLAAGMFLVSTHLQVAAEVRALRADLEAAQGRAPTALGDEVANPVAALRALPARTEVPRILRQLFDGAARERLAVDTAKYEIDANRASGVVRYRVAFPVTGTYPQIRAFIDATLATMPAVALSGLALERRSIADGDVQAQIRVTIFTRSGP